MEKHKLKEFKERFIESDKISDSELDNLYKENFGSYTINTDNKALKAEIKTAITGSLKAFLELSKAERKNLLAFIEASYRIRYNTNTKHTSYGLKHHYERWILGDYVTNEQFKGAMLISGYKVRDTSELNWNFNVQVHKWTPYQDV